MPIKPENRHRYPPNWPEIRAAILLRAGHCCEGSPDHPDCRAANRQPHPETGFFFIVTVSNVFYTPENCAPENLRAMCQRCHLNYDLDHHQRSAWKTRHARRMTVDMFEQSGVTP